MKISEIYEKHGDEEFMAFKLVANKTSTRPDIHAFMLLDRLLGPYVEGTGCDDIVSAAEHDEIWLSADIEKLESVATEDQIIELIRCGVRYDSYHNALAMFV